MDTILLHPQEWDLLLDANGNIAKASDPYAKSQDVASACKLFKAELWYNQAKGVPYFEQILGHLPTISLLKSEYQKAALSVPDIVQANTVINKLNNRAMSGSITFTDSQGVTNGVSI